MTNQRSHPRTDLAATDPAGAMLVGHGEREQALGRLRDACVDGRLTLAEFSERTDAALAARTHAEITEALRGIPVTSRPASRLRQMPNAIAVLGASRHRGRLRLGEQTRAVAVMGECVIDLRDAEITDREPEIDVVAVMGGVKIFVPAGVEVDLTGVAVMGEKKYDAGTPAPHPDAPCIHVHARVVMGSVEVKTVPAAG